MEKPQPAIRAPRPSGQAPRRPPMPARPAPRPPAGGGPPPIDLRKLIDRVGAMRQVRAFRASSAFVRWLVLIVVIGFGAALLVALVISLLVAQIPSPGG